jgi:hypothetical protein
MLDGIGSTIMKNCISGENEMKLKRDGNMLVNENGTVVCLMCECDSFGVLHKAFNADENARIIMDAVNSEGVPVAWLYEDDLPDNYPYDAMFPYSKVEGVRMFPVYGPPATIKPLEWERGEYISKAKSIDTVAFNVIAFDGDEKGWVLYAYFKTETKRTHHQTRQAAEDAAQLLHNAEVGKYLSG